MITLLGVQVTDPDSGDSAAFIYSYEQGRQVDGTIGRIGAQIMGPGDGYIAQTTTDTSTWWADRNRLRLGACFEPTAGRTSSQVPRHVVPEVRSIPCIIQIRSCRALCSTSQTTATADPRITTRATLSEELTVWRRAGHVP